MTTRLLTYSSSCKLACDAGTDLVVCVTPGIVYPHNCPDELAESFPYSYIDATLVSAASSCLVGMYVWTYVLSYDDGQLSIPPLKATDITGLFCRTCLTSWIDGSAGAEPYMTYESGNVTYTDRYVCSTTLPLNGGREGVNRVTIYGNGSDGDFTVAPGEDYSQPFPARNRNYNNLTIDENGIYRPWGLVHESRFNPDFSSYQWFQIFVKDTLTINGTLSSNLAGYVSVPDAPGGTAAGSNANEFLVDAGPGGMMDEPSTGGTGSPDNVAPNSEDGAFSSYELIVHSNGWMGGGLGGKGGDAGAGGLGGDPQATLHPNGFISPVAPRAEYGGQYFHCGRLMPSFTEFNDGLGSDQESTVGGGCAGGGGGGGSRTGTALGGGGGGGGCGGGPLYVAARHIVIGPTGKIDATGTDGGRGADATMGGVGDSASGGGGGGGGGGGLVYLIYDTIQIDGVIDVSGGLGAPGGASVGGLPDGATGEPGLPGHIHRLNMVTGEFE